MLLLVNFKDVINSSSYFANSYQNILSGDELYILDTDDWVVEKADYKILRDLILSGKLDVFNIAIDESQDSVLSETVLYHGENFYDLFDTGRYSEENVIIQDKDKLVTYYNIYNNLGFSDFRLKIDNQNIYFNVREIIDERTGYFQAIFNVNMQDIFIFNSYFFNTYDTDYTFSEFKERYCQDGYLYWIPYLFRLGNYIVVKLNIRDIRGSVYTFNMIFDLKGNLIDFFSQDSDREPNVVSYWLFSPENKSVRTKYLTLLADKY